MEHRWEFCAFCGWMVVCGKCGNNCCNGGHGTVDGKECDACPSAYEKQEREADEHPNPPDLSKTRKEAIDRLFGK